MTGQMLFRQWPESDQISQRSRLSGGWSICEFGGCCAKKLLSSGNVNHGACSWREVDICNWRPHTWWPHPLPGPSGDLSWLGPLRATKFVQTSGLSDRAHSISYLSISGLGFWTTEIELQRKCRLLQSESTQLIAVSCSHVMDCTLWWSSFC